jgi:hypothetical protein
MIFCNPGGILWLGGGEWGVSGRGEVFGLILKKVDRF